MKKMILPVALVTAMYGCSKNSNSSTTSASIDCSSVSSTYAASVQPLVQSYCATNSGCHASGSHEGPGALTTYQQLYNNRSAIRSAVLNGSMPQGTSFSTAQKAAVVCWIDNGALNN